MAVSATALPAATKYPQQNRSCNDEDMGKLTGDTDVTILHGFISGLGFGRVVASTASLARMCLRLLPTWKVVSSQLDPIQI